jgi:hypothetical protein
MRLSLFLITLLPVPAFAQVTFTQHIAPIVFDHCVGCHRPGEIGPMPLTNYAEVSSQGNMVEYVTSIRYMPPWRPDPSYSTLRDENWLTDEEIGMIAQWVEQGMPEGDPDLMPALPEFPTGSQVGTPDLVLTMEEPYLHYGTNSDQYQIFVIPTGVAEDHDVEAIEVRADNKEICHHAILGLDVSGTAQELDAQDPEYGYTQFGGFGFDPADNFFGAWVPGANPLVYPPTIGKKLLAGSDLLLQMHYGPSSIDQYDQTSVNIFFSDTPVQRYVGTYPISPYDMDDAFIIPPGQERTFHGTVSLPFSISVIGVAPHAHLLGKSFELYATSPDQQDTIRMVRIPEWNFNWQGLYAFPSLVKVPAGYTVHYIGTYDNTASNPFNPSDPPQWVTWGEGTQDEMYLCFVQYVPYMSGDEDITLSAANAQQMMAYPKTQLFPTYPNPASDRVTVGFSLAEGGRVSVVVYDAQGRSVLHAKDQAAYPPGRHKVTLDLSGLSAGTYLYQLITEREVLGQRIIKTD